MADLLPPVIATLKADISDFDSKMGKALGSLDRMQQRGTSGFDQFARVGKAAFLSLSTAAVGFGAFAIKQAAEQEEANARLTTALKNVGSQMTATSKPVEELSQRLIKLGFDDADTADSLAKLTTATKSPAEALKDESLAADVARGRHIDLAAATDILVKVETGHVAMLGRIGINTKDAAGATISQHEALQRLSDLYGGQASAYAGTFAGKMAVLHAELNETAEKLGNLLIPLVEKLSADVGAGADWLAHHTAAAKALAVVVGGPLVAAMSAYLALRVKNTIETTVQTVGSLVNGVGNLATKMYTVTAAEGTATIGLSNFGAGAVAASGGLIALEVILNRNAKAASDMARNVELAAGSNVQAQIDALTAKAAELRKQFGSSLNLGFTRVFATDSASHAYNAYQKLEEEIKRLRAQQAGQTKDAAAQAAGLDGIAGSADDVSLGLDGITKAATPAERALDALKSDTMALANSQQSLREAQQGVADAVSSASDAHRRLNDLLKKNRVDTEAVTQAQRDLDTANRSATDAQERLTQAKQAFDDLVKGPSSRTVTDANLRIADTTDGVQRAQIRLREAQAKLSEVQSDGKSSADDIASAQLDVNDATRGVTEAQESAADAQAALNDLMAAGLPGSDQYATAQKNVSDAEQAVKDAQQAVIDATGKLNTAQQGDLTLTQQIADAKKQAEVADRAVGTAKERVTTATLGLYDAQQKETDALGAGGDAAARYLAYLQNLVSLYPQLANDPLLATLRALVAVPSGPTFDTRTPSFRLGGPHAAGGSYSAGELFQVNDSAGGTKEYARLNQGGTILPLGPASGGGGFTIAGDVNITVDGSGSPQDTALAIQRELLRLQRNNGGTVGIGAGT